MSMPDSGAPFSPSATKIPLPFISFNLKPEHGFLKGKKQKLNLPVILKETIDKLITVNFETMLGLAL